MRIAETEWTFRTRRIATLVVLIGLLSASAFVRASDDPPQKAAAPGTSAEERVKELEQKKEELWREFEPVFRRRVSLVPADIENMIIDAFYADQRVSTLQSDLDWLVRERVRIERATARHPSDPSRTRVVNEIRKIQKAKDELWRMFEPRQRRRFTLVPADIEERLTDAFQADPRVATIQAELDRLQPERPKASRTPAPPLPGTVTAPPPPRPPLSNSPLRKEADAETDPEAESRPGLPGRADRP
jgi:hypothetical protein